MTIDPDSSGVAVRYLADDDGGCLRLLVAGDGPPVVLLHGVTLAASVWQAVLLRLRGRCRVIAPDLRGHGESRPGDRPLSLARLAEDLVTVLERLDLRDAVVVGHSMGGMVLLEAVHAVGADLNGRLGGAVFASTYAGPATRVPGYRATLEAIGPERLGRLASQRPASGRIAAEFEFWMARRGFGPRPDRRSVELVADLRRATPDPTVAALLPDVLAFDRRDAARCLARPAAVVVGTADRLTPAWHAEELARLLPDADLVYLRDAGHTSPLERPEELAIVIAGVVARVQGAG